jgi:hypothetical protein
MDDLEATRKSKLQMSSIRDDIVKLCRRHEPEFATPPLLGIDSAELQPKRHCKSG